MGKLFSITCVHCTAAYDYYLHQYSYMQPVYFFPVRSCVITFMKSALLNPEKLLYAHDEARACFALLRNPGNYVLSFLPIM